MKILLDIDGVLVTTPSWRVVELDADGFMKFNEKATQNLIRILNETSASIVLTTTHRISYTLEEWNNIFKTRGIIPHSIEKVNDAKSIEEIKVRTDEVKEWVEKQANDLIYVVLDDDTSIYALPEEIKSRCVLTKSMTGLDQESALKAIEILKAK